MSAWMIKLSNDSVISSDDITVAHLTLVGQLSDTMQWADLDPTLSAGALISWVAVLEAQVTGQELQESLNTVMRLSVAELNSRFKVQG
jgi:hypothetical protein